MVQHQTGTSESEEMYLITVARAVEDGRSEPVSMSHVATQLDVTGVSVNQMIRKLDARGYVDYEPYRGVSLTEHGRAVASSILRRRRLWGVFLSEQLGMTPARADDVACDLEHVTPDEVADLLSGFLGDPSTGPQGRAIPAGVDEGSMPLTQQLSVMAAGTHAAIVSIDLPDALAAFVADQGLDPGASIEVLGVGKSGDRLVAIDGACLHLGTEIADGIRLEAR
ncbi:MAG: DtxR family transcriptional regulator [Acidimicrobiia bacterium]